MRGTEKYGIDTIGTLAGINEDFLNKKFGKMGKQLYIYSNGLDESPVRRIGEGEPMKSVGNGMTFKRDLITRDDILTGVTALADSVARRMRRSNVKCQTVQVTIKDTYLKSITRQKAAPMPTNLSAVITATAMEIIENSWRIGVPIRLLTITAQKLIPAEDAVEQISLFESSVEKKAKKAEPLENAMDRIRERYGSGSILHGNVMKNDLGIYTGLEDEENE